MDSQAGTPKQRPEIREGDWCSPTGSPDRLIRIADIQIGEDLLPNIRLQEYRRADCGTLHLSEQEDSPAETTAGAPIRDYQHTYRREFGWCETCGEYGYFDKGPT